MRVQLRMDAEIFCHVECQIRYLICTKRFCFKKYWVVIPAAHHSIAEEVSPDCEAALPHFESVCCLLFAVCCLLFAVC